MGSNTNSYSWTTFYMEFADKLLTYKDQRQKLLSLLEKVYDDLNMRYPFAEKDGKPIDDICPFTVIGSFNKGITNENRMEIAKAISNKIGVKAEVPSEFEGIPVLNNLSSWFFAYKEERNKDDITNLWKVFETAIQYADNPTGFWNLPLSVAMIR